MYTGCFIHHHIKMKSQNYLFKLILLIIPMLFISCDNDDDDITIPIVAPDNYEFLRDGSSTATSS